MVPFIRAVASVLGVVLAACGTSARDAEVRELRARVEGLQARQARYETQITDLQNQVFLITDQVGRERADADAARPPPRLQVVKLAPPAGKKAVAPPEADVVDIELTGNEEPAPHVPVAKVPPPPAIPRHDPAEVDALFREALTAFREGRAQQASELFARFVERYPEHAHADKALYWMGESRFEAGAFAEAVANFKRLLVRYPRSSKVPDALFRMGVAQERLGATTEARQAFQDLVTNYPTVALADLARARLAGEGGGSR
jgi:tol-pal system protein YbgF